MGLFYGHNTASTVISSNIKFGRLYNWFAASTASFAPTGWRVPTNTDYAQFPSSGLIYFLGGTSVAGDKLRETGTEYWVAPNTSATNSSNFTARGGGYRYYDGSTSNFLYLLTRASFWTQTQYDATRGRNLIIEESPFVTMDILLKKCGFSIRLIATTPPLTTQITDLDNNIYDIVQIGTQYWLKQNWACTKLNDGTPIPNVTTNATWSALTTGAYCAYNNDENNVFIT